MILFLLFLCAKSKTQVISICCDFVFVFFVVQFFSSSSIIIYLDSAALSSLVSTKFHHSSFGNMEEASWFSGNNHSKLAPSKTVFCSAFVKGPVEILYNVRHENYLGVVQMKT